MLSRRMFAGLRDLQRARPGRHGGRGAAQPAGLTRKEFGAIDYPDGKVSILMTLEVAPEHAPIARHTHPGIESSVVTEGEVELQVERPAGAADTRPAKASRCRPGCRIPAATARRCRGWPSPMWSRRTSR